jgi:hypothetical protein
VTSHDVMMVKQEMEIFCIAHSVHYCYSNTNTCPTNALHWLDRCLYLKWKCVTLQNEGKIKSYFISGNPNDGLFWVAITEGRSEIMCNCYFAEVLSPFV